MTDIIFQWLDKPGSLTSLMLILVFCFIFSVFIHAQLTGKLSWYDLVCRSNTNIISLSKVLQLVGGIVATWIVIKSTLLSNGDISWEIFTAYLAYVGSVEGFGKYITLKHKTLNAETGIVDTFNGGNIASTESGLRKRHPVQENIKPEELSETESSDLERVGGAKTIE